MDESSRTAEEPWPTATTRRLTVPAAEELIGEKIPCLDHGFVYLVDYMGSDASIVQAARVSYGRGTRKLREDRGLIRYLLRHRHTTPFEMVELKFHAKLPIFVARQWIRHRTASVNEYSLRYSQAIDEFYVPDAEALRFQSRSNRQGRSAERLPEELARQVIAALERDARQSYATYRRHEQSGLARELARIGLGVNLYTQWYWKIDFWNLLHFLRLRLDPHAQHEIRVYAEAMARCARAVAPLAYEAFDDYVRGAEVFSRLELEVLRGLLGKLGLRRDGLLERLHEHLPEVWLERRASGELKRNRERGEFLAKIERLLE